MSLVRPLVLLVLCAAIAGAQGATSDSTTPSREQAQKMMKVDVNESAVLPTWMVRSGFDVRRQQGLGAFLTEQDIGKHTFSDLTAVLQGIRGIRLERTGGPFGTVASVYLNGQVNFSQRRCVPNYFLDGAPFHVADAAGIRELIGFVKPEGIKGIEVYSNPGTIPAQYDMMSFTGCGSIVIWTR